MSTTKLFQITEYDLAVLEVELPRLLESACEACNDPLTRKRWQMVKGILSNVRWDYGPPSEVQLLSPDDLNDGAPS